MLGYHDGTSDQQPHEVSEDQATEEGQKEDLDWELPPPCAHQHTQRSAGWRPGPTCGRKKRPRTMGRQSGAFVQCDVHRPETGLPENWHWATWF